MERFDTEIEREFFRNAYKATWDLAHHLLEETNSNFIDEEREDEWPAMQEWDELSGSSQSIFMDHARKNLGLDPDFHKNLLRTNTEAMVIAIEIRETL